MSVEQTMSFAAALLFSNTTAFSSCVLLPKVGGMAFFFFCIWTPLDAHGFFTFLYRRAVSAINGLYVSLGSPKLPGWIPNGGDPCGELWQGITCTGTSITSMYVSFFTGLSFRWFWFVCFGLLSAYRL
jgi:hypothetical protein